MHTERLLSAGMAVVVIAAVGLSASTLASSMSTDPADAVDVEWETLPLGEDSQGEIEAAAQNVDETYRQSGAGGAESGGGGDGSADSERSGNGDASQPDAKPGDGPPERQPDGQGEDPQSGGQAGEGDSGRDSGAQQGQSRGGGAGDGSGLVPGGPSWMALLWLALLLAAVILAYRYRDRLRRALGGGSDEPADAALAPAPQNEVERAWVELVRRAGVDRPRTLTPHDCARRAVETGFDPGQVERLRRTFEDVRYGTTPPTDEQARRARETLAALDGERT